MLRKSISMFLATAMIVASVPVNQVLASEETGETLTTVQELLPEEMVEIIPDPEEQPVFDVDLNDVAVDNSESVFIESNDYESDYDFSPETEQLPEESYEMGYFDSDVLFSEDGMETIDENTADLLLSEEEKIFDSAYLEGVEVDPYLKVEDTVLIYPQVKEVFIDANGEKITLDAEGEIQYEFMYDEFQMEFTKVGDSSYELKRLQNCEMNASVIAKRYSEDDDEWYEIASQDIEFSELNYNVWIDGLREGDHTWIFSDESTVLSAETDAWESYAAENLTWEWFVATYEHDDPEGLTEIPLAEGYTTDGASISLDASILKEFVNFEERNIGIGVTVKIGDCELAGIGFGLDVIEPECSEFYQYNEDIVRVPDNEIWVDKYFEGEVSNQEHPWGDRFTCEVTEVSVADVDGENICTAEYRGENWCIITNDYGMADATVKYIGYNGEEKAYTFRIYVSGEALYLNPVYPNDNSQMLTNSELEIGTTLFMDWNYGEDDRGSRAIEDYQIYFGYDEEGHPSYDTNLFQAEIGEDGKTIIVRSGDNTWGSNIWVGVKVTVNEGTEDAYEVETGSNIWVNVTNGFCYLEDFNVDSNLKVGETATIYPHLKEAFVDENGEQIIRDVSEEVRYHLEYDENCVQVTEGENFGYELTRILNHGTGINVIAERYNEEDDEWYEVARREIWLQDQWYDLTFEGLREGEGNFTWIFNNEECTVYPVTNAFDEFEDTNIVWQICSYEHEDQDGSTEQIIDLGYQVNDDQSITLDGEALNSAVSWEERYIRVNAKVMGNGVVLEENGFGLEVREPQYRFEQYGDLSRVPDNDIWIPRTYQDYIEDSNHPWGDETEYTVTNVAINEEEGNDVCFLEESEDGWNIYTNSYGTVEVTVDVETEGGIGTQYSFRIYVNGDALYLEYSYLHDTNLMLKNSQTEIYTWLRHDWNYGEDNRGSEAVENYRIQFDYDEEGNPSYDTNLLNVEIMEDGKSLRVYSNENTWNSNIYIYTNVKLNEGTEGEFEIGADQSINICVTDAYYYIQDLEWDINLQMEDSLEVSPQTILTYVNENGEAVEEVQENVRYRAEYNENDLRVRRKGDSFIISRNEERDTNIRFVAEVNEDGEYHEITSREFWLNGIEHSWEVNYQWSVNGYYCLASALCKYCLEDGGREHVRTEETERKEATCTEAEKITYLAHFDNELFEDQTITVTGDPATGHTEEIDQAVEATYTKTGLTEGKHCSVCGEILVEQKVVAVKKLTAPVISAANAATGITVRWDKIDGATGYYVYRGSTKIATVSSGSTVSYADTEANTSGTKYTYKVYATVKTEAGAVNRSAASKAVNITKLAKPVVTLANAAGGVAISWNKIEGATGYEVYRGSTKIKAITSGSTIKFTDTAAKTNGTKYTYKVYATVGSVKSVASDAKAYYFLSSPAISKVVNNASKTIAVTWGKNAKATGYQVKYQIGTGTAKTVTIKSNATVTTTIANLTVGKTYNVYVRSYKTVSGTNYYSAWSPVKAIKVAK